MNKLKTSAEQNRGSDYNVVYVEFNSPEGLSISKQFLHTVSFYTL